MNIEQIKELITLVEKSAITSFEIEESGYRIRIGKEDNNPAETLRSRPEQMKQGLPHPGVSMESSVVSRVEEGAPDQTLEIPGGSDIKSPMLGVFYDSPSPEDAPFVKIGDRIKKGQVLCIIEAMKLMNEILAEKEGEITGICLENGQIAEYAQTLFTMK